MLPDPKRIDEMVRKLAEALPAGGAGLGDDLRRNLRAGLETALKRMDLVTREEFDVQRAVLLRTRERLETLAARVAELETTRTDRTDPPAGPVSS